ncbi:MAG: cation diffusion facilitator family transporter [Actinomycetota bacterium]|nr:cation diffusion facilitator family transporter [Actinomycetota bacterium]
MAGHSGRKAIIAALVANAGIAVAKLVAFLATGAASMLAESIHSVADSSNQGLLLLGRSRSQRKASPEHPFGHARERYFWSFVVAIVLFTLGGVFSIFEGYEKLRHPEHLGSITWAVTVLVVAIVLETFSLRTAVRESAVAKGQQSWWSFIRTAKTPELPVVLLEDIGALLGLVFALVGLGLADLTGNSRFDALGSVVIGVLLAGIGLLLAVEMKSLLIGESASPVDEGAIREALGKSPHVRQVIELRSQHLGPDELMVAAKVELDADLSFRDVARVIDDAEARVRERLPAAIHLYVEPDLPALPDGSSRPTEPASSPPRPSPSSSSSSS